MDEPESTRSGRFGKILVSARGLQKAFHARTILKNVDFDMLVGDITVIIGKSGSGKSTLLRALAGLTDPDAVTTTRHVHLLLTGSDQRPGWRACTASIRASARSRSTSAAAWVGLRRPLMLIDIT